MNSKLKDRLSLIIKYIILFSLLAAFMMPLVSMVVTSLKQEAEIFRIPPNLFPDNANLGNYVTALTRFNYPRILYNSLMVSVLFMLGCTLSSSMAGYAFSRFRVRENKAIFTVVLSSMMIPYVITIIPFYLLVVNIGLKDKHLLWLFYGLAGAPFLIYLYRQFFSTIPRSFEESARIDGAGRLRIFFQIMFPLVQSGTVVTAIFAFQWSWNNYLIPALFLNSSNTTLAVKLNGAYVDIQQSVLFGQLMAGVFYYIAVPVLIFFIFQRQIMRGMLQGGIKG